VSEKNVTYYPAFLNLTEKTCVVFGGGRVAERKVRGLLKAGARVTVISPDLTLGLARLRAAGKIQHAKRRYRNGDAKNAFLVIAATSDATVNEQIAAQTPGLVNAVDMPDYCSFIMPSVVRKRPLTIAISSSGISPALSKALRRELEHFIPEDLSKYLRYLRKIRMRILKSLDGSAERTVAKRSRVLKELGSPKTLAMLKRKGLKHTKSYIDTMINRAIAR
jgi:precorrin-2 dehydrogenase/sirohydrochlorin ferrochelatase